MSSVLAFSWGFWILCIIISTIILIFGPRYGGGIDTIRIRIVGLLFSSSAFVSAISPQNFYVVQDNSTITVSKYNTVGPLFSTDIFANIFFTLSMLVMLLSMTDLLLSAVSFGAKPISQSGER